MPPLSRPGFRRFWLGQSVSQVGDGIHDLAVLWLSYSWTRSGLAVGGVMIAATLPGVLLGPLAGNCADRWNRRNVLVVSDLVRAASTGWLAFRAWQGALALPELIAVTAVMSIATAFFTPAAMALVPNLVPEEELSRANAMNQISANACSVAGPLLGSGLVAFLGAPLAFAANGISFLGSAGFEAGLKVPPRPRDGQAPFFQELKEGWRAAVAQPLVTKLMGPIVVVNFFFSSVIVLIPVLGAGIHGSGPSGVGMLLAGFAGGMLLSALSLSFVRIGRGRGWAVAGGIAIMGLSFVGTGLARNLGLAVGGLAGIGLCLTAVNVILITLYQEILPDAVRGKVFGLLGAISLSLQPIAYGAAGALVDILGTRNLLVASGAVISACGLLLLRVRELRAL
jgi:MFS transporter, DHA3 family, macrolide efflux protein